MRRPDLLAARVVAAVGAVFWGWLFFGVQDMLAVLVEGQDFAPHYLTESGWGLLFLVLVAVPLAGLAYRPRSPVLVVQVGAVGFAVMVGALLARSAAHLLPGVGVILTALVVAGVARLDPRPVRLHADPPLLICTLAALIPACFYAWRMGRSTANVEKTIGLDHYPIQAALGVAVVLVAAVIAVARESAGARLAASTLTITVAWIGVESVIYPHRLGSFGALWGSLATAWAIVFLMLALRPRTRSRQPAPTENAQAGRAPRSQRTEH